MKTMLDRLSRAMLACALVMATPLAAAGAAAPTTPTDPDAPALKGAEAEREASVWIKTEENARRDYRLAVAARRYVPIDGEGPPITLYGAVHIADARFYETLQSALEDYEVVLFEGVNGGKAMETPAGAASMLAGEPVDEEAEERPVGLQKRLAETFGLSFQLEEMDSERTNWRNSDMSMDEVMSRLRAKDIDPGAFFSMLDGSSMMADVASAMLEIIERIPFAAVRMKVLMMETLASADELMMSNQMMGGAMLEVIIEDRNEVVVEDLRALLAQDADERPASIAVLYGAGHLDHLAERVESEFGYEVEATRWITAIKVNLDEAGISKGEMRMWRMSLQQQLAMARAQAAAAEKGKDEAPDDE